MRFFRKITWFIGNKRALSKFLYGILYYLISINQIIKKMSIYSLRKG